MNDSVRHNLDLSGVGSASGGEYQDVRVQGIGKVHGDLDCVHCDIVGVSEILGRIQADTVNIHGKAKIQGDVIANQILIEGATSVAGQCEARQKLTIHGRAKVGGGINGDVIIIDGSNRVDGDCKGHDIKVRGRTVISGGITAEDIFMHGTMHVGGSCEAETFRSDGTFEIAGLLTADKVYIRLERSSRVKEIGGEEIRVEKGRGFSLFQRTRHLNVESIEGDDVYLENTKAKVVRGNKVILGPSCNVERVEYHTEFRKAGTAKIGSSAKI
jgi:cytoskeletal protein CcmA (bactofilin family)